MFQLLGDGEGKKKPRLKRGFFHQAESMGCRYISVFGWPDPGICDEQGSLGGRELDPETDGVEDLLVKKRQGAANFEVKLISNTVKGVHINPDREGGAYISFSIGNRLKNQSSMRRMKEWVGW